MQTSLPTWVLGFGLGAQSRPWKQLQSLGERPSVQDLTDSFRADLDEGILRLGTHRVMLLQTETFRTLRKELIEALGIQNARALWTRVGWAAGCRDARITLTLRGDDRDLSNVLFTGANLHAFQGSVAVVPVHTEVDIPAGHCFLEFLWKNSVEDQVHIQDFGISETATCWMEVGYASGFLSTVLGRLVVVREVECRATGHPVCRCIGRFAEEWDDAEEDLRYLMPAASQEPGLPKLQDKSSAAVALRRSVQSMQDAPPQRPQQAVWVGQSPQYNVLMHSIERAAKTQANVLLLGESGVGKTALARKIHEYSPRRNGPFVEVNCAAIPENLLEAELFGAERGAFTSAHAMRVGRFEEANGGTLFLDEIADLSPTAQSKLLRVLQSRQFERLGSSKTRETDVRVVAATNADLKRRVQEERFRLDLFYRLNVFPVTVPPLRDRKEDLALMVDEFISYYAKRHSKSVCGVSPHALDALLGHSWPGNIRELENVIERAVIMVDDGAQLCPAQLAGIEDRHYRPGLLGITVEGTLRSEGPEQIPGQRAHAQLFDTQSVEAIDQQHSPAPVPRGTLLEIEKAAVLATLKDSGGNLTAAANALAISRAQLDYRLKKWGVRIGA